jgi:YihY family inner membrane protein
MNAFEGPMRAADRFQQRRRVLAFPVAVWKKFSDDQAGNLAALIAYYAFAALFPLLLVLATVLDIALSHDPELRRQLLQSALAQYPVIGPQINARLGEIPGTGLPLAAGAVLLLLGARGVAGAMQNAMCEIWGIARADRPGFPKSQLWAMALLGAVSVGFLATTFLSGLASGLGHLVAGAGAFAATVIVSLILNFGMFWLGFRLATMFRVRWRDLRTGAAIAAVCWQLLQMAGGYVVSHQLHRASQLYGTFGVVLGLLAWLFLQAEVSIYAAEVDVVLTRGLWPRSLLEDDSDQSSKPDKFIQGPRGAAESRRSVPGERAISGGSTPARHGGRAGQAGNHARDTLVDVDVRPDVPPPRDGGRGGGGPADD